MSSKKAKKRIAARVLAASGFWRQLRFITWVVAQGKRAEPFMPRDDIRRLRGVIHCHTAQYSDGAGTVEDVMDAAATEGFDFVFLTDHNSVAAARDGYIDRYSDRVPFLRVGNEITVEGGAFLLAGNLPATFNLEPRLRAQAAIDAVLEAGGIAAVSLPFDMKHPWDAWDTTGTTGLEVINFSTVARDHINLLSLVVVLILWRIAGLRTAIRWMIDRPDESFAKWDLELARHGRYAGIGALDAHGITRIGKKWHKFPSYADSFCALSTHVFVDADVDSGPAAELALFNGRSIICYDLVRPLGDVVIQTELGALPGDDTQVGDTLHIIVPVNTIVIILRNGIILNKERNTHTSI
ncbi:MAG: hypothetical protein RL169_610, partial [Armatimonadota bacterium]